MNTERVNLILSSLKGETTHEALEDLCAAIAAIAVKFGRKKVSRNKMVEHFGDLIKFYMANIELEQKVFAEDSSKKKGGVDGVN